MFTRSDKVTLGICGAVAIVGILMIHKGLKGLKILSQIHNENIIRQRLEKLDELKEKVEAE